MSVARALRPAAFGAFSVYGLEVEYMLVRRDTLDVAPVAEQLLAARQAGTGLAWSNEIVAHVVELKNPAPTPDLAALANALQREVREMNAALAPLGARLMPTAMHPWMDPARETHLWPHDNDIYRTYDRIFGCRAHGWANLQSVHINLPFADDGEFARLHAAVRLALPIIPAIAAASPFADGTATGWLDYRLHAYAGNAPGLPQMNGEMIPEPAASRAEYQRVILAPLYAALAPQDPEGLLRHEWANARGAIARFERSAIEIRLADAQECPAADVAIAAAIIDLVWLLYRDGAAALPTGELAAILRACMRDGERAQVHSPAYVAALTGGRKASSAGEIWAQAAERMPDAPHRTLWQPVLDKIQVRGPLARRLVRAVGETPSRTALAGLYEHLCECLENGVFFDPTSY
ncbi:MAG: glutamate--cysteine ligase [Betaproteobacteria bacterium]|nr:glutamate--cysteine ligase [Betaproteobacteria bacterium]